MMMTKEHYDEWVKRSQLFTCKKCGKQLYSYKEVNEHAKEGHHQFKQNMVDDLELCVG